MSSINSTCIAAECHRDAECDTDSDEQQCKCRAGYTGDGVNDCTSKSVHIKEGQWPHC